MTSIKTGPTGQATEASEMGGTTESLFMSAMATSTLLGVGDRLVRRALIAGRIPGFRMGTTWRVLSAFVYDFLAEVQSGRAVVIEDYAAEWMAAAAEGKAA